MVTPYPTRKLGPLSALAEVSLVSVHVALPISQAKGFVFLQSFKIILALLRRNPTHLIN